MFVEKQHVYDLEFPHIYDLEFPQNCIILSFCKIEILLDSFAYLLANSTGNEEPFLFVKSYAAFSIVKKPAVMYTGGFYFLELN